MCDLCQSLKLSICGFPLQKDPYLELSDDIRLKIVNSPTGYVNIKDYGSAADDRDAYKSFSGISISEEQAPEALAALIVGSSSILVVSRSAVYPFGPIFMLQMLRKVNILL